MKTTLVIMVFLVFGQARAQKIHFSDSTNSWVFARYSDCAPPYLPMIYTTFYYGGDTVINSLTYHRLKHFGVIGFIREDTMLGKVFIKNPSTYGNLTDTLEHILFDYNLSIGDTLNFDYENITSTYVRAILTDIDSTLINGIYHKVQTFHQLASVYNNQVGTGGFRVIEGVGAGSYWPVAPMFARDECPGGLLCFRNKGVMPHTSAIMYSNTKCIVGVDDISSPKLNIVVRPNPLTGYSKVIFSKPIGEGYVRIYNILGQCVYKIGVDKQTDLGLGNFRAPCGVYFLIVEDKGENVSYSARILVE
jgi:hypothetical protein